MPLKRLRKPRRRRGYNVKLIDKNSPKVNSSRSIELGWVKTSRANGIVAFEKPMLVKTSQSVSAKTSASQTRKGLLSIIGEKRQLGSDIATQSLNARTF